MPCAHQRRLGSRPMEFNRNPYLVLGVIVFLLQGCSCGSSRALRSTTT